MFTVTRFSIEAAAAGAFAVIAEDKDGALFRYVGRDTLSGAAAERLCRRAEEAGFRLNEAYWRYDGAVPFSVAWEWEMEARAEAMYEEDYR